VRTFTYECLSQLLRRPRVHVYEQESVAAEKEPKNGSEERVEGRTPATALLTFCSGDRVSYE
jgi:hypothetical protein